MVGNDGEGMGRKQFQKAGKEERRGGWGRDLNLLAGLSWANLHFLLDSQILSVHPGVSERRAHCSP